MKKNILFCALVLFSFQMSAQKEHFAISATGSGLATTMTQDYECIGVNPANVGLKDRFGATVVVGAMQMGFSNYAQSYTREQLMKAWTDVDTKLSLDEKQEAGLNVRSSLISMDADVLLFGASANVGQTGGLGIAIVDRVRSRNSFNNSAGYQLFMGWHDPYFDQLILENGDVLDNTALSFDKRKELRDSITLGQSNDPLTGALLFDGTQLKTTWYREFNFSYSNLLFKAPTFNLFGGLGVKYIQGMMMMDLHIEDNVVQRAISASTPGLQIDYGSDHVNSPSYRSGESFEPVGTGYGIDLGFTAEWNGKTRASFAITDIGSIKWDGNVYEARDTLIYDTETEGINSYNIFDNFDQFVGQNGQLIYEGVEERTTKLPMTMRGGVTQFIREDFNVGAEIVVSLNDQPGSQVDPLIIAGIEYYPSANIKLGTGAQFGGNYGFRIPFSASFMPFDGQWEMGVGTRDVVTWISKSGPTLSMAIGFLRFRFGAVASDVVPSE